MTHEGIVYLFQHRPSLAAELITQLLGQGLPPYESTHLGPTDLETLPLPKRCADVVVILRNHKQEAVAVIVVEVQLRRDDDKLFSWPVYLASLRAQHRCAAHLLVVTPRSAVARWAQRPIADGSLSTQPLVVGPEHIPVVTSQIEAQRRPELGVLSVLAHGASQCALSIAQAVYRATPELDIATANLYIDLVMSALSTAAQKEFQAMIQTSYEYQSDFARRYFFAGEAKVVLRLLAKRFGSLDAVTEERVRAASLEQLDQWAERLLDAPSLDAVFG